MPSTSPTIADRTRAVVERFSFRNLTLALGVAALFAGVAAALTLRAAEEYESSAVLLIDNPFALATGDEGTVNKLDKLRGKYATLANTRAIAGPVAVELGIRPGAVIGSTEVFAAPSTLALVIVGRAGTERQAVDRASAMADGIIDFVVREHEANDVPREDRFTFEAVQPATFARQTSPSTERALEAAAITFALSLVATYVALQFVRAPVVLPREVDDVRPLEP